MCLILPNVIYNSSKCNSLAIACEDPPPDVPQSSANFPQCASDGSYPYGASVIFQCLDGRRFENGETTAVVTCTGNGYWKRNATSCDCKTQSPELLNTKILT